MAELPALPSDFDPATYLRLNPDVAAAEDDPAKHYVTHGLREGRRYKDEDHSGQPPMVPLPSDFDAAEYLRLNPDVAAAGTDAVTHYLRHGMNEGRMYREPSYRVRLPELSTPIPPPGLIYLVNGHHDENAFAISRRATVENIRSLLGQAGIDYTDFESILDFGCGCGRVLAGWEPFLEPRQRLKGCDINPKLVAFCQQHIWFAETKLINYMPPLPYEDGAFDLVYAASVYTHLSLQAAQQWTGEISRVLKPGGVAMISFHGTYYAPELARISPEGSMALTEHGYHVHLHGQASDTFLGSNHYATFFSADFMRRLFAGFEIRRIFPGVSHGPNPFASFQDIMIAIKLE